MLKQFLLLLVAVTSFDPAFGTAMSEEKSRCLGLQNLVSEHRSWQADYRRFVVDETLSADEKFVLQKVTLKLVSDRLINIQKTSDQIGNNRVLIQSTQRFLQDLNSGKVDRASAKYIMTSALRKYDFALDEAIQNAQLRNDSCGINLSEARPFSNRSRLVR